MKTHNLFCEKLIIFSFLLGLNSVFAQTFPYINYTTQNGLSNMDVNSIVQDKSGYIWFATSYGLSRFDGNTFQNYFDSDGLNSNSIMQIAAMSDSSLYIASSRYGKDINIYKNGILSNFDIKENINGIYRLHTRNDTLFVLENGGILGYLINQKYERLFSQNSTIKRIIDSLQLPLTFLSSDNRIFMYGAGGIYEIQNQEFKKVNIEGLENKIVFTVTEDRNKNYWIGTIGKVYIVKDNQIVRTIEFNENDFVNHIYVDNREIAWFGVSNKNLYYYKNNNLINIGDKINIKHLKVLKIFEDNQSNVWISVQGKGVFCINNIFVTRYNESDGLTNNYITDIIVYDGSIISGTQNGINVYEKNQFSIINSGLTFLPQEWIYDLKNSYKNNITVSLIGTIKSFPVFSKTVNNINYIYGIGFGGYQLDTVTYLYGSNDEINIFRKTNNEFVKTDSFLVSKDQNRSFRMSAMEIQKDNNNNLWIGTAEGLLRKNGSDRKYYNNDSVLKSNIYSIKIDNVNRVWVAGSNGISVILPDEKILSFSRSKDWDLRMSNSITFDNSNNIWIGNIKGLYKMSVDSILNGKPSGKFFNENNGLPANSVNCLDYDYLKNELWIGTANGLASIELNSLDKYLAPPQKVIIKNIKLVDTTIINFENTVLKPSQNNLKIQYVSPNYSEPGNIRYEYKIGIDNEDLQNSSWSNSSSSTLELISQQPGNYMFMIRACNNNYKSDITTLKFKIEPPFWKTLWFYSAVILLIISTTGVGVKLRIKNIKTKAQEKLEVEKNISTLKHRALSASLNPHFIFNTLNSVQQYNNMHTKEEANEYLVNFSRLIRLNLDMAEKTFIPLETELNRLELYLKYEKIRFGDRLSYNIDVDSRINPEKLLIPNMILQPFVENSIWHGLLPKKEGGNIFLKIKKEETRINKNDYQAVIIMIEDDGIGLRKADKLKKSEHISKGISLIKERLDILVPNIKNYEFVKIQDRENNLPGVNVTITLIPGQYET